MRDSPPPKPIIRIAALLDEMMILIRRNTDGRMLQVLQRADVTLPQILSLHAMQKQGPQRISGLAAHLRLTAGAVSRLVDRLVDKGLVDRRENETDRRQKTLHITEAGARLLRRLDGARKADNELGFTGLDRTLATDLENVLGRVVDSLRHHRPKAGAS